MSIFNNAVDSIALGIEDYNSADPRRLISATRNLVAGILLLIKHRLAEMSPPGSDDALIKQRVIPTPDGTGGVIWKGDGDKTVDVQQMKDRCTSLGIKVDWKRVEKTVKHRNEIEHYFTSLNQVALRSLIAESFVVIRDFLRTELGLEPLDVLGAPTWNTITAVADVYGKERAECVANLGTIKWTCPEMQTAVEEWTCPDCGSGLIDVDPNGVGQSSAILKCRACGNSHEFGEVGEDIVKGFYAGENHYSVKDGGDPVTIDCPECCRDSFHLERNLCLLCGESAELVCRICANAIPTSEIDGSGICGYCRHMMGKDD
jgi:hypothetical protein